MRVYLRFLPYLRPCRLHPPPEVYTPEYVCAAGAPLRNAYHSPGSPLPDRHRRGFLQAPPGDVLHPHPCWASSVEPLETDPGVERRGGGRSPVPRPRGWGCTRSLLRHLHHSPLQGPHSETERIPLSGRCAPKTTDTLKPTTSNVHKTSVFEGRYWVVGLVITLEIKVSSSLTRHTRQEALSQPFCVK